MQLSFSETATFWGLLKSRKHLNPKKIVQSSTHKDIEDIQFPSQVTELVKHLAINSIFSYPVKWRLDSMKHFNRSFKEDCSWQGNANPNCILSPLICAIPKHLLIRMELVIWPMLICITNIV